MSGWRPIDPRTGLPEGQVPNTNAQQPQQPLTSAHAAAGTYYQQPAAQAPPPQQQSYYSVPWQQQQQQQPQVPYAQGYPAANVYPPYHQHQSLLHHHHHQPQQHTSSSSTTAWGHAHHAPAASVGRGRGSVLPLWMQQQAQANAYAQWQQVSVSSGSSGSQPSGMMMMRQARTAADPEEVKWKVNVLSERLETLLSSSETRDVAAIQACSAELETWLQLCTVGDKQMLLQKYAKAVVAGDAKETERLQGLLQEMNENDSKSEYSGESMEMSDEEERRSLMSAGSTRSHKRRRKVKTKPKQPSPAAELDPAKEQVRKSLAAAKERLRVARKANVMERAKQDGDDDDEYDGGENTSGFSPPLHPIHALLKGSGESLFVRNIAGPDHKVRFGVTKLDYDSSFDEEPESEPSEKLEPHESMSESSSKKSDLSSQDELKANLHQSIMLLKKKLEAKNKLLDLKERKRKRLEEEQAAAAVMMTSSSSEQAESLDSDGKVRREELLKQKKDVERSKAVTYYKHLVAKQENVLAEQKSKLEETAEALAKTEEEIAENKVLIDKADRDLLTLVTRRKILDDMIADYVVKLVDARKSLHDHKQSHG